MLLFGWFQVFHTLGHNGSAPHPPAPLQPPSTALSHTELAHAGSGIEFSTLDQVIHTALAGGGLAVIDRQMIERELAAGSLLPITPVEVLGPYGYWLDIPADKRGLSKVQRFQDWLELMSNP